ncbi:radical SAM protein [Actinoplanes sp. NPDC051859]|uniref:radical SAM protein n=1 Tax=Actinoplanes sp. NPDC051859 TaxID=3363909 RepID=UPI003787E024
MIRTFAVAGDAGGITHDPATGLTHHTPPPQETSRQQIDDAALSRWPVISSADIARVRPVSLCWSPIVRCNLPCRHCLDDTTVTEARKQARVVIAGVLANAGILGIDISGGEPLLLRDLPDLARRITAGGTTAVSVTTNGWHLKRRAGELAETVDAIRVSLDGPTPAIHDSHRARGSFTRACAGIRAAVDTGLPVQVQFVLMHANQDHLQAMVDLAADLGAGGLTVLQMLPIGAGAALADIEMLSDDTAEQLVDALEEPDGFRLRLRRRGADAGGFTVVRADGRVWRNDPAGHAITSLHLLSSPADLNHEVAR